MRIPLVPRHRFHRREALQDATGIHGLFVAAALAQLVELLPEPGQFGDAHIDMGQMLVQ